MGFMMPEMPEDTAAAEEAKRQERIKQGMGEIEKSFSGFTPEFYQKTARGYTEYALPELEDQFKEAADQLKFGLARKFGTTQSSFAAKKQAELQKRYAEQSTNLAKRAQDYASQAQADVERERGALTSQLQSTADPASAAQMAVKQSELLQAPRNYEPLGDLFTDITADFAQGTYPYGAGGYVRGLATGSKPKPVKIIG